MTISLGDLRPLYLTAGPDGTVYVIGHNAKQRWRVDEFDPGARVPSRSIVIPYSFPYPLVGAGIAVNANDFLYVNTGSYSAQGDFFISVYKPKQVKSFTGFTSGGYASGAVEILEGDCFVGDPGSNDIEIWTIPAKKEVRRFVTESAGDSFTLDVVSDYLYAVSYGTQTLQIYDFRNGRLLNFLTGYSRGVAVDSARDVPMNGRLAAVAAAASVALACVDAGAARAAQTVPFPGALDAQLYVPDYYGNAVDVFPAGVPVPKLRYRLPENVPQSICVDARGTVYVADGNTLVITEFARGKRVPLRTVPDSGRVFSSAKPGRREGRIDLYRRGERQQRCPRRQSNHGFGPIDTFDPARRQRRPTGVYALDKAGTSTQPSGRPFTVFAANRTTPTATIQQASLAGGLAID